MSLLQIEDLSWKKWLTEAPKEIFVLMNLVQKLFITCDMFEGLQTLQ